MSKQYHGQNLITLIWRELPNEVQKLKASDQDKLILQKVTAG